MLVYLEGVDGSGKTTLFKQLTEQYGFKGSIPPDRHINKSDENSLWFDFHNTYAYNNKAYIVDRGWLTEIVYRKIDKEPSYLTLQLLDKLTECLIIECISPTAYDDAIRRGENNITDKNIHSKIEEEYRNTIGNLLQFCDGKLKAIPYCYKTNDISSVIKFINKNI